MFVLATPGLPADGPGVRGGADRAAGRRHARGGHLLVGARPPGPRFATSVGGCTARAARTGAQRERDRCGCTVLCASRGHLVAASTLHVGAMSADGADILGIPSAGWELLVRNVIPQALPAQSAPLLHQRRVAVSPGLFVCGDHRIRRPLRARWSAAAAPPVRSWRRPPSAACRRDEIYGLAIPLCSVTRHRPNVAESSP